MYMKTQGFSLPGSALFYLASAQNGICGKLLSFHQISFSGNAYTRMVQIDPINDGQTNYDLRAGCGDGTVCGIAGLVSRPEQQRQMRDRMVGRHPEQESG